MKDSNSLTSYSRDEVTTFVANQCAQNVPREQWGEYIAKSADIIVSSTEKNPTVTGDTSPEDH